MCSSSLTDCSSSFEASSSSLVDCISSLTETSSSFEDFSSSSAVSYSSIIDCRRSRVSRSSRSICSAAPSRGGLRTVSASSRLSTGPWSANSTRKSGSPRRIAQRLDRQVDDLHAAVVALDRDALARHRAPGLHRFAEHGAQVEPQALARHRQKLPGRRAGGASRYLPVRAE